MVRKVCDYHDEFQFEVLASIPGLAKRVGQMGVDCIKQAGEQLELNVPLDGEYKIGANWGETH
jgi:DNA polymerase I-like protein with 3'-5' exonuclease and polymerase domains